MSPFSHSLYHLRTRLRLRQVEFARRLGYEQSYISALERCAKGAPPPDFLARLSDTFELDMAAIAALKQAWDDSQRQLTIPLDAPAELYQACNELRRQITQLHPAQIEMIRSVLRMPAELSQTAPSPADYQRDRPHI